MTAWTQTGVPGGQAAYEGQTVTAVDLIANPHRNLEAFYSVVTQKAGQPYSEKNVETSVAGLEKMGKFEKIEVSIVPDAAGLRLNFLLEPAYFIGAIDFPGAPKSFSYTRLLQVVELPDQSPYDQGRLPVAEEALRQFLRRNGYFTAEVHASLEIDDVDELVSVAFVIDPGKQAKINSVSIEGVDASEGERLRRTLRSLRARFSGALLKAGKPYSEKRTQNALNWIRKTLVQQHHLANHVEENPPRYDASRNRVDVSFKVQAGPTVAVRVTGARLSLIPFVSSRQMKKLIPIYSEGMIDRELVAEGQRNLTNYFQKKGYFDANVKTDFERKPDQILLTYEIDRGKKSKVASIAVRGNKSFPQSELLQQVLVKRGHFWSRGRVSEKLLAQSVKRLEGFYVDKGYADAKVTSELVRKAQNIFVTFSINEGAETTVNAVEVQGNDAIPTQQLTAPVGFRLRSGGPFSPRMLAEDRNRIAATYLNKGYPNIEVTATVRHHEDDPHSVDVTYKVAEGQMVRVGRVLYLGQRHTKLSLLKKTAKVPAEAPMERSELLEAESRLYDLNIFDWASVGPKKPITDQAEETALVKVHEAKRNDITYGFGFEVSHRGGNVPTGTVAVPGLPTIGVGNNQVAASQSTFASPRGSIEFTRRNMRGLGESASALLVLSRLDQRALITYTQPHFFGSQWQSLSSFSVERTTENPLFAAGLGDLSFQLERLISHKHNLRLQLRYDFNKTTLSQLLVPELVLPMDRNIHLSTFSGTLIHDTRDKPLDAHRGVFSTLNLAITPSSLGSSASFAKLFGQYAFYKPVGPVVFANSIRLGLAKAYSDSFVPTSQLFFSGGGTSLRGFPLNEAGPQRIVPFCNVLQGQTGCVNVTVPVGGRQLFILNSEIRFPLGILKPLGGVVFYDGGNVYSAVNFNNFVNNYTNTIGIGLRYSTPIGPVRIDVGRNLNPLPGISATQYYITLGQSF